MELPAANQRLDELIFLLDKGNKTKFAQRISSKGLVIKQQTISRIFNIDKRSNSYPIISGDVIAAITNSLPEVNINWLLHGDGEMFTVPTAAQKSIRKPKTINNEKKPKGMPVYEAAPATLSNIESYRDEHIDTDNPDYWLSIPQYRKCNYATRAKGDSMHPIIKNNAIVGGREIHDIKVIVFGEIYIVHTKNGIETVKYIHPHDTDKDVILLVPYNGNAKTTPVHKSEIQRLYLAEFTINPL